MYLHFKYKVGVAKQAMNLIITIDSAAQYNDKGEWFPLKTDKWLHVCLEKVRGHGSQRSYSALLYIKLIN